MRQRGLLKTIRSTIAGIPLLGRFLLVIYRAKIGIMYLYRPVWELILWLFSSKETSNFTYALDERNLRYLAALISDVTGCALADIFHYFKEISEDDGFHSHVLRHVRQNDRSLVAHGKVQIGRRIGWYAFARAVKPRVIIETGVDKGLGSCVLIAALKRNESEGHEGRYIGTDINPEAGYLLSGDFGNCGKILYGDSIDSLRTLKQEIDLFINDSDHSPLYEAKEYETIAPRLSRNAIILGDNSHCSDKLFEFALESGRNFIFFQEKPSRHWYPGAGIGIAFRRKEK
jgi:predicted O-methyltransferase YrrM